tara:strand:- start:9522 stop:10070 length:549 start_codon:yes stop_codon:yes gene_type:complete
MSQPPETDYKNFDHEIPCYVFGYYNGEEDLMGTEEERKNEIREQLAQRIADSYGTDPWRDAEPAVTIPPIHRPAKNTANESFTERMRDKRLVRAGFSEYDKIINQPVLMQFGNGDYVYECRITEVSARGRAVYVAPMSDSVGKTISAKMEGWWLLNKVKFIDKVSLENPKKVDEKDMTRTIL